MNNPAPSYHGYRFPAEIIAHAVWLYFRFSLSLRDVEDLLAQRGITVTYETIRQWCRTFGGIVKLSEIGLTDSLHTRLTTGSRPSSLGVDRPSFR